jgi:hypothetical protein
LREIENSKKQVKQKSDQNGSKSRHFGKPAKESKHKLKVNKAQINFVKEYDEETFCLFCMDSFSKSVDGEEWVQCIHYQLWAHEKSTGGVSLGLICPSSIPTTQMIYEYNVLWKTEVLIIISLY